MAKREYQVWLEAMRAKGHDPVVDEDGELDMFVLDTGHHNGPGCKLCDWSTCMHCHGVDAIPQCTSPIIEGEAVEKLPAPATSPFRKEWVGLPWVDGEDPVARRQAVDATLASYGISIVERDDRLREFMDDMARRRDDMARIALNAGLAEYVDEGGFRRTLYPEGLEGVTEEFLREHGVTVSLETLREAARANAERRDFERLRAEGEYAEKVEMLADGGITFDGLKVRLVGMKTRAVEGERKTWTITLEEI